MGRKAWEIIKLTAVEVLRLIDSSIACYELATTRSKKKCFQLHKYLESNSYERSAFVERVAYLKRRGLIEQFTEGKGSYFELTSAGKLRLKQSEIEKIVFSRPEKWDRKWRVVIFDIPEKQKIMRNCIRRKLYEIGFLQIQKSVFIYPFECTREIQLICDNYGGRKYLKYLIADIVEGEEDIIEKFLDAEVLNKSDLK